MADSSSRKDIPASDAERDQANAHKTPDGAWAWIVCISGTLSVIITFGCPYNFGLLFPLLLDEFEEGKAKTAWVGSLAVSSSGLLALITGKLCTIFGPRLVIATGAVLCAGGLLLTTQVTSITWMYLTYGGLFGLGSSCIYMATFVEVPKHFIKRRSLATALIAMGPGGGLFIMSPVVQALLDALHWRHALMTLAGMVTLCGILGCTYSKRLSDNRYDKPRLGDDDIALHRTGSEVTTPRNELSFLRNPLYVSVMLITAVSQMGHSVLPVHLIRYSQDIGISASSASRFFLCSGLGSQVARLVTGRLCDFEWFIPRTFLHAGLALDAICSLLLTKISTYSLLLLLSLVYGISDGLMACGNILHTMSCLHGTQIPLGFGIAEAVIALAFAGGPPLGGLIADIYGDYAPTFYVAGSFTLIGFASLFLTYRLKPAGPQVRGLGEERASVTSELLVVVDKVSVL